MENPIPEDAYAIRPVRIVKNELRMYEPYIVSCLMWWNRCRAMGMLDTSRESYALIDVLDENGDIVGEFGVNHKGFNYLRRKIGFKVDYEQVYP